MAFKNHMDRKGAKEAGFDRADWAVAVTLLLTLLLVIGGIQLEIRWATALYGIGIGMGYYAFSNLIGVALIKLFGTKPKLLSLIASPVALLVPVSLALYLAGIAILVVNGASALWSMIF